MIVPPMRDLSPEFAYLRLPFLAIIWLGIVTTMLLFSTGESSAAVTVTVDVPSARVP